MRGSTVKIYFVTEKQFNAFLRPNILHVFGYNKHSAVTSKILSIESTDNNVKVQL